MLCECLLTSHDTKRATKKLNKSSNLKISRNDAGKLYIKGGEVKNDYDKALKAAITDSKITVNLKANSVKKIAVDGKVGKITLGAYGGSYSKNGKTEAIQFVNMDQAETVEKAGVMKAGNIVGHEVIESHLAAKENNGNNRANTKNGDKAFNVGHNAAIKADKNFVEITNEIRLGGSTFVIFKGRKEGVKLD